MIPTRRDFSRSDENRVVALYFYIEKNGIQREFNSVIIVKYVCLRLKFAEKLQNRYIKCTIFALLRLFAFEKLHIQNARTPYSKMHARLIEVFERRQTEKRTEKSWLIRCVGGSENFYANKIVVAA